MHRAANLRDSELAWWYATGVESWIKSVLKRDLDNNQTDSLEDAWAKPVDYLPVDEGSIRGAVIDQQGLFNLNNLGVKNPALQQKYLEQFERLFQIIPEMDAFAARPIATALRDWMDADDQPAGMDGAEDSEYLTRQPPHRTSGRYLESVSELLAIKGMTPDIYRKLLNACPLDDRPSGPCVTVLPQLGTPLNVNTAPEPVLRAMVKQMNPDLTKFLNQRREKPAENVNEVQSALDASSPPVTVSSQFFQLRAEIFIGSGRLALYSFYHRPAQGVPVVLGRSTDSP